MEDILIIGLGTITKALIEHISKNKEFRVTVYSEHYKGYYNNLQVYNDISKVNLEKISIIITCFRNDKIGNDFWNKVSIFSKNLEGKLIVDMSTSQIETVKKRKKYIEHMGAYYVECPFTGSKEGSENGKLNLFVYHEELEENLNAKLEKLFLCISMHVYNFSENGVPTKFKLIYNYWGATILLTLKYFNPELFDFNKHDMILVKKILQKVGWMSKVVSDKLEKINNQEFDNIHFKAELMVKDLNYAMLDIGEFREDEYYKRILDEYLKIENLEKDYTIIAKKNSKSEE